MKQLIGNYRFNSSAHTVTFPAYISLVPESILLITNVTRGVIIYNFADPNAGGTVLGNVLTLTYNTSSQADTDNLQIFFDDGLPGPASVTGEIERKGSRVTSPDMEQVLNDLLKEVREIKAVIMEVL